LGPYAAREMPHSLTKRKDQSPNLLRVEIGEASLLLENCPYMDYIIHNWTWRDRMPARRNIAEPAPVNLLDIDAAARRRLSGPGLRTFVRIAEQWGFSEQERLRVLGRPGRSTYHLWIAKARAGRDLALPFDALLRISAVLGIHKALEIIFARQDEAARWLRSPNAGILFGDQRPVDLLTSGSQDHLMLLRRHLDAWRGGTFSAPRPDFDATAPVVTDGDIVFV